MIYPISSHDPIGIYDPMNSTPMEFHSWDLFSGIGEDSWVFHGFYWLDGIIYLYEGVLWNCCVLCGIHPIEPPFVKGLQHVFIIYATIGKVHRIGFITLYQIPTINCFS